MRKNIAISAAAITVLAVSAFALTPSEPESGLKIGETVSAFHPTHVTGPLAGTDSCPPCTYGNLPMVQAWVNGDKPENITAIAKSLDAEMKTRANAKFKAFVIVLTSDSAKTAAELKKIGEGSGLKHVALAYLDKSSDSVKDYKFAVNGDVVNTVFVYRNRKVDAKFVNLKADKDGLVALTSAIGKVTQ